MNSLQLISKIKSKADDINFNIHEILDPASPLHAIQKELLKKECLDLFELLLKLKADSDQTEDKIYQKPPTPLNEEISLPETPAIKNTVVESTTENRPIPPPELITNNFKEVMNWAERNDQTLDAIESKVELKDIPSTEPSYTLPQTENKIIVPKKEIETPSIEPIQNEKNFVEPKNDTPIEVNVEKAIENKRIQYTVMPAMVEPKPLPLNANFSEKEISYNEKIAQKIQTNTIPLAEKTFETQIDSLKTAINLNKKIAFVNELFKENVVEYARAIDKLNNAGNQSEALIIFNELKHANQWQGTNELVQELEKLVKRRYI